MVSPIDDHDSIKFDPNLDLTDQTKRHIDGIKNDFAHQLFDRLDTITGEQTLISFHQYTRQVSQDVNKVYAQYRKEIAWYQLWKWLPEVLGFGVSEVVEEMKRNLVMANQKAADVHHFWKELHTWDGPFVVTKVTNTGGYFFKKQQDSTIHDGWSISTKKKDDDFYELTKWRFLTNPDGDVKTKTQLSSESILIKKNSNTGKLIEEKLSAPRVTN